jgi:chemotaxis protein MotA
VASANVIFLPAGARLKQLSQQELHARALIVEGILSIQAGDNPRVVQEKLITYVPPSQRPADGESVTAKAGAEKAAA